MVFQEVGYIYYYLAQILSCEYLEEKTTTKINYKNKIQTTFIYASVSPGLSADTTRFLVWAFEWLGLGVSLEAAD